MLFRATRRGGKRETTREDGGAKRQRSRERERETSNAQQTGPRVARVVGISSLFKTRRKPRDVRISASGLRAAALIFACPTGLLYATISPSSFLPTRLYAFSRALSSFLPVAAATAAVNFTSRGCLSPRQSSARGFFLFPTFIFAVTGPTECLRKPEVNGG